MTDKAKKAGAKLIVAAITNNLDKCTVHRGWDSKVICITLGEMSINSEYDYEDRLNIGAVKFRGENFFDGLSFWEYRKLKRLFKRLQKENRFEQSLKVLKDLTSYVNQAIGD
jgi:hypothetical protein